ncbi:hypothetical protein [Persephonella sp.]|uniref:hypothetical protein n=1 Tax=Persephonella sp. TaxID=2060922 RepID=UPI00261F24E7|nr:hypothetical protein [Persephonella sp.]
MVIFAIAISWIPDGLSSVLSQFISPKYFPYIQFLTGFGLLLTLFFIGNYFMKKKLPNLEIISEPPAKKKNLILFLSPSNTDTSQIRSFEDFKNIRTSWQMPVIAIKYHLPELKNVYVILSSRSKNQFKNFVFLIKKLFPEQNLNIVPIGLDKNIDFENMEELKEIIEQTYDLIKRKYKAKDKEIIIDITGGQKLVSIVGALQTLIKDREFQYVSTSDYSVKSFDIKYYEEE